MRAVVGNRCRALVTGSAPLSPVVSDFLKIAL